ncbi:MAG TPA: aspartate aminotransferase family protein [Nitrospirae bacterium]|nr:aspartate aminotransferase family protein [Nitrospirota bacterium]
MAVKKYNGVPYHLWNPFTVMDEFLPFLGFGPLVITRGQGPYVFNDRGKRYINGLSSLWNVAVGHGREEIVEAAAKQMRELAYASCFRQTHPKAIELAAKLVQITSGHFGHVYLASNGSEAVETALKMTRQYHRQSPNTGDHGRYKIISLRGSYHGVSHGALSTSGQERDAAKFGPLVPGFLRIEPPYCYRCPYGKDGYPECGLECALALEKTIQSEGAESVAAFIMEPVMGVMGIIDPPEEFYRCVGEICRRHGLIFIVDEVTTGFGRTGKLFVSEDWNPGPDILCLGKAISSGYLPLAATLATGAVYQRFNGRGNQFDHGSTASGHPVCAAVGLENIDIITRENMPENAAIVGAYLKSSLKAVMNSRRLIGDIRGKGLMIGIELVKDREKKTPLTEKETFNIVLDIATLGLVVYYSNNVLGLLPPLIIKKDIADRIVEILDKALNTGITADITRKARMAKELAASRLSLPLHKKR